MATTRQHFHEELGRLERSALGGLDLVTMQLDRVLEALEHRDIELAQFVVVDDDRLDGRYLEVHQGVLSLLALQSPVAGDRGSSPRCSTSSRTWSGWATSA